MKTTMVFLAWFFATTVVAQSADQFDLLRYQAPKGWTREAGNGSLSYIIADTSTGHFAKIIIYRSIPGNNDLKKDFEAEWKDLVQTPYKTTLDPDTTSIDLPDGWRAKVGVSAFTFNNSSTQVSLVTGVHEGIRLSLVMMTNTSQYTEMLETFSRSVSFMKPSPAATTNTGGGSSVTAATYTYTTSRFDDGWVSTVQQDHVLVEKGDNAVYLLYAVPYDASKFSGTGLRDAEFFWDQYVTKMFRVSSKQFNDGSSIALRPPYMEGYATDLRTGKACFIGMYLLIVPNAATLVIGTAPDEASFRRLYPKANDPFGSDLGAMDRYNKFAVSASDLVGQWQNGNTETAQWYYVSPSGYEGYAGMTLAATSATFIFNSNGSYSSIHNGATGAVGNMSTFQQEFKGDYTVTDWSITATKRFEGRTDRFDAYFVAVRGGRILRLNNGAGQKYDLVRR